MNLEYDTIKIISETINFKPFWRFENLANLDFFQKERFEIIGRDRIGLRPDFFYMEGFNLKEVLPQIGDVRPLGIKVKRRQYDKKLSHSIKDKLITGDRDYFFYLSDLVYNSELENYIVHKDYWLYIFFFPNVITDGYSLEFDEVDSPDSEVYPDLENYICDIIREFDVNVLVNFFEFHYQNYRGDYQYFLINSMLLKIWEKPTLPELIIKKNIFRDWLQSKTEIDHWKKDSILSTYINSYLKFTNRIYDDWEYLDIERTIRVFLGISNNLFEKKTTPIERLLYYFDSLSKLIESLYQNDEYWPTNKVESNLYFVSNLCRAICNENLAEIFEILYFNHKSDLSEILCKLEEQLKSNSEEFYKVYNISDLELEKCSDDRCKSDQLKNVILKTHYCIVSATELVRQYQKKYVKIHILSDSGFGINEVPLEAGKLQNKKGDSLKQFIDNPYQYITIARQKNGNAAHGTTYKLYLFFQYVDKSMNDATKGFEKLENWFEISGERYYRTINDDIEVKDKGPSHEKKYIKYANEIREWINQTNDQLIISQFNSDYPL